MAHPEHLTLEQSRAKFDKTIAGRWGLEKCPDAADCHFCAVVEGDIIEQYRNLFVAGIPTDLIPPLLGHGDLDLTQHHIENHGYRQHWDRRRKAIKGIQVTPELAGLMVMRRFVGGMNFYSPNTSDKMVEAAMKLAGVGQNVNVAVSGGLSWEQVVTKRRATPAGTATIITVADDDFVEVEEDDALPALEGPDAASD